MIRRIDVLLCLVGFCFFLATALYTDLYAETSTETARQDAAQEPGPKPAQKPKQKTTQKPKQKTTHTFAVFSENKEQFYQYAARNRVWKFRVGYRTGGTQDSLNVGLEHDWITLGTIQRQGAYKIFLDPSRILAWSSAIFQGFYWNTSRSSVRPLWGLRLGIDPAQIWVATNDSGTRLGMALGRKFGSYEARLLYQHTQRERPDNVVSHWDAWSVRVPSSTSLHQLGTSQKFRLSNILFIEWVVLGSVSNTEQLRFSSYAQMHLHLDSLNLKLGYTQAEQYYIHEDWKYANYLWSASAELTYKYRQRSFLRSRVVVREYHPFSTDDLATDNGLQPPLSQLYSFWWQHLFEGEDGGLTVEPHLGYAWKVHDLTHSLDLAVRLRFSQFSVSQGNSFDILLRKLDASVEQLSYTGKLALEYSFLSSSLRVRALVQLYIEHEAGRGTQKQELRTELGFGISIARFRFSAKLGNYVSLSDPQKHWDIAMDLGLQYTIQE